MTTHDIATELVALCNQGQNMDAMEKFYAPNITSIEVMEPMRELHGIDAVRGKAMWWADNHVVHSGAATGPWVNGNNFIVQFDYDITQKATGNRIQMKELAYYTVENGKIVHEQFFY
jgi:hypothetical protein